MSKNAHQSARQKELDRKHKERMRVWESVVVIVNNMIRWGFGVWMVSYGVRAVEALAGRSTGVSLVGAWLGNPLVTNTVLATTSIGAIVWGKRERKLRHDKTEYLQRRIFELEKAVDPHRSSSRLTKRGTTNPLDQE